MNGLSARDPAPALGLAAGIALAVLATLALLPWREDVRLATPALVLVLPGVVAGLIGGRRPALASAVVAAIAFDLAFLPPYWAATVDLVSDGVALAVFLAVAATVGTLVAREVNRRRAADRSAADLQALHDRFDQVLAERERLAEEATRLTVLEQVDEQ
ncbi:MAG TPA: DUF4118 domain-containing protein, partial [Acidimicrobiales bacterium]